MAQKRNTSLPKITDFLASSSTTERESGEERDSTGLEPATKRAKHRDSFDVKWKDEFPWLRYVPPDQEDGPSLLCTICPKHNESSKRMVWLTNPCKLLCKDKIRDHERSKCHTDTIQAEAMAVAARRSGGIRASMEEQVSLQRQEVRGAFKCL